MNNMEIKVGDRVRVREDAPKIYIKAIFPNLVSSNMEVTEIEDECARIKPLISKGAYLTFEFIIPLKYLIKVEDEKKEAKFKKGDKVRYNGYVYEVEGLVGKNRYTLKGLNFDLDEDMIEPYAEPTEEKIKVGDRVRHLKCGQTWKVTAINGDLFTLKSDFGHENVCFGTELELVKPTEHTETEEKKGNTIRIPVKVDLDDTFWDAYAADLAKEIAVKVANKYSDPKEAGEYAVLVAKAVVEGLKRK